MVCYSALPCYSCINLKFYRSFKLKGLPSSLLNDSHLSDWFKAPEKMGVSLLDCFTCKMRFQSFRLVRGKMSKCFFSLSDWLERILHKRLV